MFLVYKAWGGRAYAFYLKTYREFTRRPVHESSNEMAERVGLGIIKIFGERVMKITYNVSPLGNKTLLWADVNWSSEKLEHTLTSSSTNPHQANTTHDVQRYISTRGLETLVSCCWPVRRYIMGKNSSYQSKLVPKAGCQSMFSHIWSYSTVHESRAAN